MSTATYTTFTREGAKTLDEEAWSIVAEAQDLGWKFRRSSKGHLIGRAPDGKTTMSVARDSLRARSGRNQRAEFERWKHEQQHEQVVADAGERAVQAFTAGLGGRAMRDALDGYVANNFPAGSTAAETMRSIAELMLEHDKLTAYLGKLVVSSERSADRMPLIMTNDLDAEAACGKPWEISESSRPWRIQWLALHPDTFEVLAHGGPQMRREDAEQHAAQMLADRAQRNAERRKPVLAPPTTETTVKMHVCTECDKHYENQARLQAHMMSNHQGGACEFCERQVRGAGPMARHRKSCRSNPDREPTAKEKEAARIEKVVQRRLRADQAGAGAITPASGAADPTGALESLMAVLADYDRLRSLDLDVMQARIVELETERDDAVKQLGEAEARLTMMREALGA
jgi:hypothetical protein